MAEQFAEAIGSLFPCWRRACAHLGAHWPVFSLTDQRSTSEILLTYLDIPVESWTKAAEQLPLGQFHFFF